MRTNSQSLTARGRSFASAYVRPSHQEGTTLMRTNSQSHTTTCAQMTHAGAKKEGRR